MAETTQKRNFIARTLFIIGGLILFIVLVVFIFKLIPILVSGLGSTFGFKPQTKESIIVTTDTEIIKNQTPVVVSFAYEPTQMGQYFVTYSCADGLFFDIQSSDGPRRIICNTPFKLGTNINSIALMPVLTKANSFVDSTLKIEYKDVQNNLVDTGTKTITITSEGSSMTNATSTPNNPFDLNAPLAGSTVTNTALPAQTTTQAPTQSQTPRPVASPTRDITVTAIYPLANQSTFVMNVYNYGNTATGPWTFTYTDAENPSRTILAPMQGSLGAGQGMAITVRFDGQVNASQIITVMLDPYNQIAETNNANNTATVTITGRTSGYNPNPTDPHNPNERADFVITSIEVGEMRNGRFVQNSTLDRQDRGVVRFTVQNRGGQSTNSWRYEVRDLPLTSGDRTYRSPTQASLRAGEYRELYVEFDGLREGRYNIEVIVDSDNDTREEREGNNRESRRLDVRN